MTFPKTKKKFGQHFLYDLRVLRKIINTAGVSKNDIVLEIGGGTGLLTKLLAENAAFVYSFEIDKDLCNLIVKNLEGFLNIKVLNTDFLRYDLKNLKHSQKLKLVANIPYNITSPIIEKLSENKKLFSSIYILVQEELAKRITALPQNKNYSSFSVYCQYHFNVKKLFNVSPKCFHPWPKVNSVYVLLTPKEKPSYMVLNENVFFNVVKSAFWGKRKMLRTSLLKSPYLCGINEKVIEEIGKKVPLNKRPNELEPKMLAEISNIIFQCQH